MLSQSLSSYVRRPCCVWKVLFPLKPSTTSGSSIHTDSRNLTPLFTPSFPLNDNLKPLYFIFCLLSQRSLTQRHLCSGESKVRMFCHSQLCWYTVGCFTWLHNKYVSYLFNVLTVCVCGVCAHVCICISSTCTRRPKEEVECFDLSHFLLFP